MKYKINHSRFVLLVFLMSGFAFSQQDEINKADSSHVYTSNDVYHLKKRVDKLQNTIFKNYGAMLGVTVHIQGIDNNGTGVIVSPDGLILTAAHVARKIKEGEEVKIKLYDGRKFKAKPLGRNNAVDCGLLKIITKEELPYAKLGKTSKMVGGEACIMFGCSGAHKEGRFFDSRIGFISGMTDTGYLRTSATMMPGDSGGPLFNMKGQVIGICCYSSYGDVTNNFYATTEKIKENWDDMLQGKNIDTIRVLNNKHISIPYKKKRFTFSNGKETLKQAFINIDDNISHSVVKLYDDSLSKGQHVAFGTIINRAGSIVTKYSVIQAPDSIIIEYRNGKKEIAKLIDYSIADDIALLQPIKNHSKFWIDLNQNLETKVGSIIATVSWGKLPSKVGIIGTGEQFPNDYVAGRLGIRLDGTRVAELNDFSAAEKAGLLTGDNIKTIDQTSVNNQNTILDKLQNTYPTQIVTLQIERKDSLKTFNVKLGNPMYSYDFSTSLLIPLSERRRGFPLAFRHDMLIAKNEVGAPVVDLNGNVIGINISRTTRTASYAIPSKYLFSIMKNFKVNRRH